MLAVHLKKATFGLAKFKNVTLIEMGIFKSQGKIAERLSPSLNLSFYIHTLSAEIRSYSEHFLCDFKNPSILSEFHHIFCPFEYLRCS